MRLNFLLLISAFICFLFLSANLLFAEDNKNIPRVFLGAGGSFGVYNVRTTGKSDVEWESGNGYGGGVIFEKMLNNRFGIHSGLWFTQFNMKLVMTDQGTDESTGQPYVKKTDMKTKTQIYTLPLYLMTVFDFKYISINLLTGINISYIAKNYLTEEGEEGSSTGNLRFETEQKQFGPAAGLELKFRITRYINLFVSGIYEHYLSGLINADDKSQWYLYDMKVQSGLLLRTF